MKIDNLYTLQAHLDKQAYIAHYVEERFHEYLPRDRVFEKKLDILRDCSALEIMEGKFSNKKKFYDCIIAHLVLLWQRDLTFFLNHVKDLLAPSGVLLFSTLCRAEDYFPEQLAEAFVKLGFSSSVIDRERVEFYYDHENDLTEDLEMSGLTHDQVCRISSSMDETVAEFEIIYAYVRNDVVNEDKNRKIEIPINLITKRVWE